ncbi:hypothetical protein DPEC_G00052470 [Dallia pectoralis]|uniref:Uncharacterized protein n=1 Tax=Dallia pectoralis TaxID=75939 RepID=A0ACC2HBI6_DALPE|nr:hypothetical protein DPEC_G00052470 [Dallia pectoralis]
MSCDSRHLECVHLTPVFKWEPVRGFSRVLGPQPGGRGSMSLWDKRGPYLCFCPRHHDRQGLERDQGVSLSHSLWPRKPWSQEALELRGDVGSLLWSQRCPALLSDRAARLTHADMWRSPLGTSACTSAHVPV